MTRVNDSTACLTIRKLNDLLEEMDIPIVKTSNITVGYSGSKGIHFNSNALAGFAMNLKSSIKEL